jgi:drug/metabolite transporter (DMT)-like permease
MIMRMPSAPAGTIACLASGAAFGAMGIFGKLAYGEGATVGTLLSVRFGVAAVLLWALLLARGGIRRASGIRRRHLAAALALGAVGYALQAGCYFAALTRIDASLLALVLYTFPALVAGASVALGRERMNARRLVALGLALGGLALVVAGAGAGALDPVGTALGLGAAVVYSGYILAGEAVAARVPGPVLTALVCSGAAASLTAGSAVVGDLRPGDVTAAGWGWLAGLALVSTVIAIGLFFAGLSRVGPTNAAILATVEPLVTAILAFAAFGETLGAVQIAGGALIIIAVLVLQTRALRPHRRPRVAISGPLTTERTTA